MAVVIDGNTGIDKVQDGSIVTADLAAGAVTAAKVSDQVAIGGRRNLIINGAMQVAQRGTSQTVSSTSAFWGVDRFAFQTNANTNSTIEQSTDVPTNQGFKYSFKLTNGTAYTPTGSDFGRIYTRLEGYDVNHMNLGTASSSAFTLSFWVKSSLTGTFGGMFGGNGNGIYVFSYSISAANTWEKKTITVPAGTITTYGGNTTNGQGWQVSWDMGEGPDRSNAAGWHSAQPESEMGLTSGVKVVSTTSSTWQITGVQMEVGDTATPFEHRSFVEELLFCKRYWREIYISHGCLPWAGVNSSWSGNDGGAATQLDPPMRAAPTLTQAITPTYSSTTGSLPNGVSGSSSSVNINHNTHSDRVYIRNNATGDVVFAVSTKSYLDAEL